MTVVMIPIVTDALRTVLKGLVKRLKESKSEEESRPFKPKYS